MSLTAVSILSSVEALYVVHTLVLVLSEPLVPCASQEEAGGGGRWREAEA